VIVPRLLYQAAPSSAGSPLLRLPYPLPLKKPQNVTLEIKTESYKKSHTLRKEALTVPKNSKFKILK